MSEFIKPESYDTCNSIFALWVAYEYKWSSKNSELNTMTYFTRYINDKNYDGNVTEVNRVFKILSERLSLDYLEQNNPMKVAILYRNKNRGKTIAGVKNPPLFKITLEGGFMVEQALIYRQNMSSDKEIKAFSSLLLQLENFSKSEKHLLNGTVRIG